MSQDVLIIGSNLAATQAALDLANSGIKVHLVERSPFLQPEGLVPSLSLEMKTRHLETISHPNIHVLTNTVIQGINFEGEKIRAELNHLPRYVNINQCIACGECINTCPVVLPANTNVDDKNRKPVYLDGQPGIMAIEKAGKAPCASTCPGGIHVQGYIALIAQKRYREAIELILDAIPFPSVCGRVCNHYCEQECSRGKVDDPVNIMALKRFVSDWAFIHRSEDVQKGSTSQNQNKSPKKKQVAIIGAGPAGLTAARSLVRSGYKVTVFDSLPTAGGMMRVGIPPHRLPHDLLDWEIQNILDEGVEIQLNTRIEDIPGLMESGYDAVLIATGAHRAKKLGIKNSDHPDNLLSLDVLREACLSNGMDFSGKRVIVLGGGNVALDTARTVIRSGANEVRMVCLEPRGEMPGFKWEIGVAEEEGVEILPSRTFNEIVVEGKKITGVRCTEINFKGFKEGRPDFTIIPNTEMIIPGDVVIWAIGQEPNLSFLPDDGSIETKAYKGFHTDENMMTTMPGVFTAGDVRRGMTFFVIDAIGEGNKVAKYIDSYLQGEKTKKEPIQKTKAEYSVSESKQRLIEVQANKNERVQIPSIPFDKRPNDFTEVDQTITEEEAISEAKRCLLCGVCSECMACETICPTGAIDHNQTATVSWVDISSIILADHSYNKLVPLVLNKPNCYTAKADDTISGSTAAAKVIRDIFSNNQSPTPMVEPAAKHPPNRIGVFICECEGAISESIDIGTIQEKIAKIPGIVQVQVQPTMCTSETIPEVKETILSHELDGVVIAACSCCNIDQVCYSCTYQRVRCRENMGVFPPKFTNYPDEIDRLYSTNYEFVNIREQCANVHYDAREEATIKANSMIAATIAKLQAAPSIEVFTGQSERSIAILGNGPGSSTCEEILSKIGYKVVQIDEVPDLVQRSGGLYQITKNNHSWKAAAILLIPEDDEIRNRQLRSFDQERYHPRSSSDWDDIDTHRPGVFFVDLHADPPVAEAAAARVVSWINRNSQRFVTTAIVDPERCRACQTCVELCEFGAAEIVEKDGLTTSWIDPIICTGCGTCAAHCPSGAISVNHSSEAQIEAMLNSLLRSSVID